MITIVFKSKQLTKIFTLGHLAWHLYVEDVADSDQTPQKLRVAILSIPQKTWILSQLSTWIQKINCFEYERIKLLKCD